MLTDNDVVNTAYIPLLEHAGYIWGKWGQVWTQAAQNAADRDMTKRYGSKWIGSRVWDCSGLWRWIAWLYGEKLDHNSNSQWAVCKHRCKLIKGNREDGEPLKPGSAVFLYDKSKKSYHHVGVYVGDGQVIEAKGTINGVVMSKTDHWDYCGEMPFVNYTGEVVLDLESIRPGCKGEAVKQLQEDLNYIGYNCGKADGIYGAKTKTAVEAFQQFYGLAVDGIAGEKTLAKIDEVLGRTHPDPDLSITINNAIRSAQETLSLLNEIKTKVGV